MKIIRFYLILLLTSCNIASYSSLVFGNSDEISDSIRVIQLIDSSVYLRNTSFEHSIEICQQSINLAEETDNPNLLSKAYKTQGINYFYTVTYDSAYIYYEKAIPQFEALNSKIDVGKVLGNIGLLYYKQGKYDIALEYYLRNLKIFKEIDNSKGLVNVYINLGNLYCLQEDLKTAEYYYQLVLNSAKKAGIQKSIADAYCNLGALAEKNKNYTKSLDLYSKSLKINSEIGSISFDSKVLFNIGYLYHAQGQLDSAISYVERAEQIRIQLSDKEGLVSVKLELARIALSGENLIIAEKYLKEADEIAIANDMLTWRSDILDSKAELYKLSKDYKKAFINQTKMIEINDSLNTEKVAMRFEELAAAYEAEKREQELELLQQESQIQNLELDKKNAWLITLMIAMILGVVAIVVSMRINRLRADHKIMDLRQKVLLTQMNPHFLFNSLTAIQSFILDEKNDEANNYLSRLASLVRGILENSREEFVSLRTELQTLEDYIGLQKLRFENDIHYTFDVDENIDQDQILVPPMLAQPFVENALIHGMLRNNPDAEIRVKISLSDNNEILRFEIKDNGIGIDHAKKLKENENHKSIATSIAIDRVKIYNFKSSKKMNFEIIDLSNKDAKLSGTQVTYTIPISINLN